MKKIGLIAICLAFATQSFAQTRGACGFIADEAFMARTLANKKEYHKHINNRDSEVRYVPLNFIICGKADGSVMAAKEENVLDMLCRLNESYTEANIQFYIYDGFEYVYNDITYEDPGVGGAVDFFINPKRAWPNAADILIGKNASTPNGSGLGITLGHYNPSKDWIVIRGSEVNYSSETFPHERGHYLSLNHPHNGWDADPWDADEHGNPVSISSSPSNNSISIELVDGSNCETAGDFLCDTPADYNLGFGWPNCNYTGGAMDPNGDLLAPDENNYMGYFLECANDYYFSTEQFALVNADLDIRENVLATDWTPIATEITGEGSFGFPESGEVLPYFNNFEMYWNLPEGATRSLVEISQNFLFLTTEFKAIVNGNSMWIGQDLLLPNKAYYVRIRPFNDYVTCTNTMTFTTNFTTGVGTNTDNRTLDLDWSVFPNPVSSNTAVQVDMNMSTAMTAQLDLVSMSGQVIESTQLNLQMGSNNWTVGQNLSSGVYFVRINTAEGTAVKKLIVQ